MREVTTSEAAKLLNITSGRVRQLLVGNRIRGARRVGGGDLRAAVWMIPLGRDGMPVVLPPTAQPNRKDFR